MENMIYPTSLSKLISENSTEFRLKDNEIAHEVINDIIKKLIERLNKLESELMNQSRDIADRFNRLEGFATTELIGKNSLQYRPPEQDEYLSLGQTLNDVYERLNKIETQMM